MTYLDKEKLIHFIGVGGCGMSGIAYVLHKMGYLVSGSDEKESLYSIRLKNEGVKIFYGHDEAHLRQAHAVVVSSAIKPGNPEYDGAFLMRLPVLRRAKMLGQVMSQFPCQIAVTGTHGKTTTSAMVTKVLTEGGRNPSFIIGSDLADFGSNAGLVGLETMVVESDESDGSFLDIEPNVGVITNIEDDHMDYFKTFENIMSHMATFCIGILDREGYIVLNADDPHTEDLKSRLGGLNRILTFGCKNQADYTASKIEYLPAGVSFEAHKKGVSQGRITLKCLGHHNVENALAAWAVADQEGLAFEVVAAGLAKFSGTKRRFQKLGEAQGVMVYDDYGHHPTEIKTTLEGIKASIPSGRLICAFQPHRYTRTQDQWKAYFSCFDAADITVLTDIYSAGEPLIPGVLTEKLVEEMNAEGRSVLYCQKKSDIPGLLMPMLKPGDLVLMMGAGDINTVGKELVARLLQTP